MIVTETVVTLTVTELVMLISAVCAFMVLVMNMMLQRR